MSSDPQTGTLTRQQTRTPISKLECPECGSVAIQRKTGPVADREREEEFFCRSCCSHFDTAARRQS